MFYPVINRIYLFNQTICMYYYIYILYMNNDKSYRKTLFLFIQLEWTVHELFGCRFISRACFGFGGAENSA